MGVGGRRFAIARSLSRWRRAHPSPRPARGWTIHVNLRAMRRRVRLRGASSLCHTKRY